MVFGIVKTEDRTVEIYRPRLAFSSNFKITDFTQPDFTIPSPLPGFPPPTATLGPPGP